MNRLTGDHRRIEEAENMRDRMLVQRKRGRWRSTDMHLGVVDRRIGYPWRIEEMWMGIRAIGNSGEFNQQVTKFELNCIVLHRIAPHHIASHHITLHTDRHV